MHPPDYTNREDRRGPLTYRHNGRGARAWLPELIADPGWVYLVSSPQGSEQRWVCWRSDRLRAMHELGRAFD